jgi:hypothetical protein
MGAYSILLAMSKSTPGWFVVCSCGWGREASSAWAANAVSRLHQQLAEVGTQHVTHVEGPGQQLPLDREDDGA